MITEVQIHLDMSVLLRILTMNKLSPKLELQLQEQASWLQSSHKTSN